MTNIEIRKKFLESEEKLSMFNPAEKSIIKASIKSKIGELNKTDFKEQAITMLRYVAHDVGYRIPDNESEWIYICSRLTDVLLKYYSDLTLRDISTAFELSSVGELDEYLPKTIYGDVDKGHYQQFNAEYFAKIINAYKKKKALVVIKAREIEDKSKVVNVNMLPGKSEMTHNLELASEAFELYKIKKELPLITSFTEIAIIKALKLNDPEISESDLELSYSKLLSDIQSGIVNKYNAKHLKDAKYESRKVQSDAESIARKRVIKNAFDKMIAENKSINTHHEKSE